MSVIFGSINTKTGEVSEGYIDKNGEMKYRKTPWYKRIFQKTNPLKISPPSIQEYVGVFELRGISTNIRLNAAFYKEYNPYTNEIYSLWTCINGKKEFYDVNAYKDGHLIQI